MESLIRGPDIKAPPHLAVYLVVILQDIPFGLKQQVIKSAAQLSSQPLGPCPVPDIDCHPLTYLSAGTANLVWDIQGSKPLSYLTSILPINVEMQLPPGVGTRVGFLSSLPLGRGVLRIVRLFQQL